MVEWIVLQFLSYPLLNWLLFVGIALLASYLGGCVGVFLGCLAVSFAVLLLDIDYAMTHEYMDMDIVFTMGVMARAVLINGALLPVSALGVLLRRRRERKRAAEPEPGEPDQQSETL
jgi:membrane protein YqaA with SNARE-associated domain